jgi:aminoglycoside phosphotransferase (APT) family kinase protein
VNKQRLNQEKMDDPEIINQLRKAGLIRDTKPECISLSGGVSSDIWLVSDGYIRLIIKRARNKLMVDDDWFSDTDRNRIERKFAEFIHHIMPGSVPVVLHSDDQLKFYAMEYLDESFENWKTMLLNGIFESQAAVWSADLLIQLHHFSRNNPNARDTFSSMQYFDSLRIEPYFLTTGKRHPSLSHHFREEAERLLASGEVLVHGDFSPKNIMIGSDKVVLLDHEVAHFGDSSFDLAFLINHLLLKRLYHFRITDSLPDLADIVWNRYRTQTKTWQDKGFEKRTGKLLLLLMLARVDGKSPVEYLDENKREFVRNFVSSLLEENLFQIEEIITKWNHQIKNRLFENK